MPMHEKGLSPRWAVEEAACAKPNWPDGGLILGGLLDLPPPRALWNVPKPRNRELPALTVASVALYRMEQHRCFETNCTLLVGQQSASRRARNRDLSHRTRELHITALPAPSPPLWKGKVKARWSSAKFTQLKGRFSHFLSCWTTWWENRRNGSLGPYNAQWSNIVKLGNF